MAKNDIITYFPKNATSVVIQHLPGLAFGCVVAETPRKIKVELKLADFLKIHCDQCPLKKSNAFFEEYADEHKSELAEAFYRKVGRPFRGDELVDEAIELHTDAKLACPSTLEIIMGSKCCMGHSIKDLVEVDMVAKESFWLETLTDVGRPRRQYKHYATGASAANDFIAKPYMIANVYDNAAVCWGVSELKINSLRKAVNYFWDAPFNSDLTNNPQRNVVYRMQTYDPAKDINIEWRSIALEAFGRDRIGRFENPCQGAIIGRNSNWEAILPPECFSPVGSPDRVTNERRKYALGWLQFSTLEKQWYVSFPVRDFEDRDNDNKDVFIVKRKSLTGRSKIYPLGYRSQLI